jgi:hypothetical protein
MYSFPVYATDPIDKGQFKKGCESGGGSYVENADDDSFQCNARGGGTVKCYNSDNHCVYIAQLTTRSKVFAVLAAGKAVAIAAPPPKKHNEVSGNGKASTQ